MTKLTTRTKEYTNKGREAQIFSIFKCLMVAILRPER